MGYSHIPQKHATAINRFYSEVLNPYLNFHRPCYFAVDKIDAKGKIPKNLSPRPHHDTLGATEIHPELRDTPQARHHLSIT